MYLSKAFKLEWSPYQITKGGSSDTGTIVMRATEPSKKKLEPERSHTVEIGWYVLKKVNEPARLIINEKHPVNCSFTWEVDPDEPLSFKEFIEKMDWRPAVAKALPEDTFK